MKYSYGGGGIWYVIVWYMVLCDIVYVMKIKKKYKMYWFLIKYIKGNYYLKLLSTCFQFNK